MIDRVIGVDALPSFLITTFRVNKVRVREEDNIISLEPVTESNNPPKYSCPFLGTAKGGSLTVDKFLEIKHIEKELEFENEKRLLS